MDTNELERQLLLKVLLRAKAVIDYDWSDNDEGPVKDMDKLRSVVDETIGFQKLKGDAEQAARISMYQNVAQGGRL
jgi:hypothetical protein